MKLFDWQKQASAKLAQYGQSNCIVVYEQGTTKQNYRKLWHLTDYVVSSTVSGPGVVLSPRTTEP